MNELYFLIQQVDASSAKKLLDEGILGVLVVILIGALYFLYNKNRDDRKILEDKHEQERLRLISEVNRVTEEHKRDLREGNKDFEALSTKTIHLLDQIKEKLQK